MTKQDRKGYARANYSRRPVWRMPEPGPARYERRSRCVSRLRCWTKTRRQGDSTIGHGVEGLAKMRVDVSRLPGVAGGSRLHTHFAYWTVPVLGSWPRRRMTNSQQMVLPQSPALQMKSAHNWHTMLLRERGFGRTGFDVDFLEARLWPASGLLTVKESNDLLVRVPANKGSTESTLREERARRALLFSKTGRLLPIGVLKAILRGRFRCDDRFRFRHPFRQPQGWHRNR